MAVRRYRWICFYVSLTGHAGSDCVLGKSMGSAILVDNSDRTRDFSEAKVSTRGLVFLRRKTSHLVEMLALERSLVRALMTISSLPLP